MCGTSAVASHGRVIMTVMGVEPGQVVTESGHPARYRPLSSPRRCFPRLLPITEPTP